MQSSRPPRPQFAVPQPRTALKQSQGTTTVTTTTTSLVPRKRGGVTAPKKRVAVSRPSGGGDGMDVDGVDKKKGDGAGKGNDEFRRMYLGGK